MQVRHDGIVLPWFYALPNCWSEVRKTRPRSVTIWDRVMYEITSAPWKNVLQSYMDLNAGTWRRYVFCCLGNRVLLWLCRAPVSIWLGLEMLLNYWALQWFANLLLRFYHRLHLYSISVSLTICDCLSLSQYRSAFTTLSHNISIWHYWHRQK